MVSNPQVGFSTGCFGNQSISLFERVSSISSITTDTIELNLGLPGRLKEFITDELKVLMKKFSYISIHAPSNGYYGSTDEAEWILKRLENLSSELNINTIVFHPDTPFDWSETAKRFKGKAAIENMDKTKMFGTTVENLNDIFSQAPSLGFVLDLNHIYTLDPTMKLTANFFSAFSDRLRHFHVSGYGKEPHDFLSVTKEAEILTALPSFNYPIIDEGGEYASKEIIQNDYRYIHITLKS